MNRIRAANFEHCLARPFTALEALDFVEYQENRAFRNSQRLQEGTLDLALIPTVDFALHGGYVGLNYGIGLIEFSERIVLYAHQDLHKLHTIYIHENCGSWAMLLKLLLAEKWTATPRLMRTSRKLGPADLTPTEGVLVMYDEPTPPEDAGCAVAEDLVSVWHEMTGLPFVFLIWAARQSVLTLEQHKKLNECFHICDSAERAAIAALSRGDSAGAAGSDHEPGTHVRYYLNEEMIEGLNHFYALCAKKNLLPATRYSHATYTPFDRRSSGGIRERSIEQLLQDSIDGCRLSIHDGMRLVSEASVADLGLAADLLRRRLFTERSISYVYSLDHAALRRKNFWHELADAVDKGVSSVLLLPEAGGAEDLSWHENILNQIKSKHDVLVEGLGIPHILSLARSMQLPIRQIASRLVTAGLDAVPAWGGEMLLDRVLEKEGKDYRVEDWADVLKWLHRFGARSSCCMRLDPDDSWEDRLVHLHTLRSLQDLSGGFRYFFTAAVPGWEGAEAAETKIRATCIARLFLDNVPSIHEVNLQAGDSPAAFCLWCGVNEIRLNVNGNKEAEVRETLNMLRSLWGAGMDFQARSFEELLVRGVH